MKNEKLFLSVFFLFFLTTFAKAQSLVFEEQANKVSTVKDQVTAKEALLVFESKFDLEFKSSMEKLRKPLREGDIYKVFVTQKTCVINIIELKTNSEAKIGFGQMTQNGLPPLKAGEIRYFNLKMEDRLELIDQTNDLKAKSSDNQMRFEKEALIVINSNPTNLELEFKSSVPITEVRKDVNRYLLYVKLQNQTITINHKESGAYQLLDLKDLTVKEMRYFYVILPDYLKSNNKDESFDITVVEGAYMITTDPPGALIQMVGQPDFNNAKHLTPYPYMGAKTGKEIITLTLNDYETVQDTIEITSKTRKNKLSKTLVPKFAYIKCNIEPAIPVSKIIMDSQELTSIVNGQPYKCKKGTRNIEISAPHFYSQTKQMILTAGQSSELNVKLIPKIGTLTIEPGENADGAEVYINEKSIGKLPVRNYSLQEGEYTISYKKSGLVTEQDSYNLFVNVSENKPIKSPKMIDLRKIKFSTEPQSGATVYIDGIEKGTTPLSLKLPVGTYKVLIKKDNYKDFSETINLFNDQTEFNYTLTPNYNLSLSSTPSGATVRVDGQIMGNTPIDILTTHGTHRIAFSESSSIRRVKHYITDDVPRSKSTVLRKEDFWGLGYVAANEGVDFGGEVYLGKGSFILSGSISKLKPLIEMPTIVGPPSGLGYGVQAGLRVPYPLDFIIHGGYGERDFSEKGSSNSSSNGYSSSYSSSTSGNSLSYGTGIAGLTLPIHLSRGFGLYFNADYWLKTENGDGLLMFSGGIIF